MIRTLYYEASLDGFIAHHDDHVNWSEGAWKNYFRHCSVVRNIIVGRRTYEMMIEAGEFDKFNLALIVVVSEQEGYQSKDRSHVVCASPEAALALVQERGFSEAIIGGGAKLSRYCLARGLVDEIYLDVEPVVLGTGIAWSAALPHGTMLELADVQKYPPNGVQLHYRVRAGDELT